MKLPTKLTSITCKLERRSPTKGSTLALSALSFPSARAALERTVLNWGVCMIMRSSIFKLSTSYEMLGYK